MKNTTLQSFRKAYHTSALPISLSRTVSLLLLLLSAGVNFSLAKRVRDLTRVVAQLKNEGKLQIGMQAPHLVGKIANNSVDIDLSKSDRPTLLYVFSPSCVWCKRNRLNIKSVVSAISRSHNVYGLALSSEKLVEYIIEEQMTFPVIRELSNVTTTGLKLGGTPMTIVLSANGRVQQMWFGAYGGDNLKEVERSFGIVLPGITETKGAH